MKLSELSAEELLEKARNEISALCGSKGKRKDWRMTIPVDDDQDSDVLFGEVLRRFVRLEVENEELRELCNDVALSHKDPYDSNYNECDKEPCAWCEEFKALGGDVK